MQTKNLLKEICITLLFSFIALFVRAQSGVIIDSVNSGFSPYAYGVAYDGSGLWVSGYPVGNIYKINPATGQRIDTILDPSVAYGSNINGMVYDGAHLWGTCFECDTLYQWDIATKQITARVLGLVFDDRVSIGYDGANTLYFANGSDQSGSFKVDINTLAVTNWGIAAPFARGLIFLNQHLYATDHYILPVNHSVIYGLDNRYRCDV